MWCGHCQDNYDEDHYTADGDAHKVGIEYGPTGEAMLAQHLLERIATEIPSERGVRGCYFCGGDASTDFHEDDCVWMLARQLICAD